MLAKAASSTHHQTPDTTIVPAGFAQPIGESLQRVVRRLAAELDPDAILLFGSYAYGVPTPDSDVDLLVIMQSQGSMSERYLAVSRLLRPRQFPADILVKTPDEIRSALQNGDFFIGEIMTRGQVLYERGQ